MHDLCVRCVKGYSVRCIKGYSVVVLMGTDAQIVRPYKGLHVSSAEEFGNRHGANKIWRKGQNTLLPLKIFYQTAIIEELFSEKLC